MKSTRKPTVLVLSFSPLTGDARVLKQVNLLREKYTVITCGFGEAPDGVVNHIELNPDLLPSQLDGRLITLHAYSLAYWRIPAIIQAWKTLRNRQFDVILANDIETIPIALRLKPKYGVHGDLHEHYPSMHEYDAAWKRRISPYFSWLCRRYASRAQSLTTVSAGLQKGYQDEFGFAPEIVVNASPYANLAPTPVGVPIRLVHSGAGQRKRQLEVMLEAVKQSDADVTLDLYLTRNDPDYLDGLAEQYSDEHRIRFHDPVPYVCLVETLNQYDVGIFVLPPQTFSYKWALPNKFFDFLQARLGVLIGPSPEMVSYVEEIGNGAISLTFDSEGLRNEIESLTPKVVERWKRASDRRAFDFGAENQSHAWLKSIDSLIFGSQ